MGHTRRATLLAFVVALAVVIGQLWSSPTAGASGNSPRATPADHRVDGFTGGQLLGQLWAVFYVAPAGTDPAPCITLGRTGNVLHPNSDATCTIEQGTAVFVHGWGGACSDVEQPPYYAVGRAAQLACLRAIPDPVTSISVVVDNGPVVDIHAPRFEAASPLEHIQLPPDNIYGIPPQPATLTALSWVALVEHLRVGVHSLRIDVLFTDGSAFSRTRTVNVVARHGREGRR